MAVSHKGAVFRQLQTIFGAGTVAGLSDAQLLERFASREDPLAFEALVVRHGSLVLGVCRNVLCDDHAAEDAFQATFLVLARRAGSIRKPGSLAPWLHGVAFRISARARVDSLRRRSFEHEAVETARSDPPEGLDLDSRAAIHEEVHRLPERYRAAVVLCYFEGLTHDQAAERLGWPVGTVRGRLARARDLLRGRLTRRGLAPTAGLLGAVLSRSSASAAVSTHLETTTIKAAIRIAAGEAVTAGACSATVATLTRGALRTMILTKLKLAGAALLIAGIGTAGAGVLAQQAGERDAESSTKLQSEVPDLLAPSLEPAEPKSGPSARAEKPLRSSAAPSIEERNDARLTQIEETLQAIKKQSETMQSELRKSKANERKPAAYGTTLLSPEEFNKTIQQIQQGRAAMREEINQDLIFAQEQVNQLRIQLEQAEQVASELQRLYDDLKGDRPREELAPVPISHVEPTIPATIYPVPPVSKSDLPPAVSRPVQLARPETKTRNDHDRDRRLDRLEQLMQRLLEQNGPLEPSSPSK
ncbi:MAG: RNA polymerase sigma factor [Isosphaeraceae bacterium]